MTIYQNVVKSIAIITIALNILALPAMGVAQDFQLKSDRGYRVETSFSHSDRGQKIITEKGKGNTDTVDYLKVRFYDPNGKMIASYDNILDRVVQGNYFEFNFDPQTQQLLGDIDLGGEAPGEIYFKGNKEDGFALIEVEPSGLERTIDSGQWIISDR